MNAQQMFQGAEISLAIIGLPWGARGHIRRRHLWNKPGGDSDRRGMKSGDLKR
jgi:hypothetical protein